MESKDENYHEKQNKELENQVKNMPKVPDRNTMSSVKLPNNQQSKKMSAQSKVTLILAIGVILLTLVCIAILQFSHENPV